MILKVGKREEGWTYIDKITTIHHSVVNGAVDDLPIHRIRTEFGDEKTAELFYTLDTDIYLMSDEGKTVERIGWR